MKKKLFALSGVFLIVLVVTGLWATRATDNNGVISEDGQNTPGTASMVNGMTVEDMSQGATMIVIGTCDDTRSQWTADRRLFTLATISVRETLKGELYDKVTVALPGGIDANRRFPIGVTFAGAPQIAQNEKVFLFLTTQDEIPDSYAVMGLADGKFSVASDNAGEEVVTRDATLVPMESGPGMRRSNSQAVRLEEFKARVRGFLR